MSVYWVGEYNFGAWPPVSNQMKVTNTPTGKATAKIANNSREAPSVLIEATPAVTSLRAMNSAMIHSGEAPPGA